MSIAVSQNRRKGEAAQVYFVLTIQASWQGSEGHPALGSLQSSLSSALPPLCTGRRRAATNAHDSQGVQSTDFVFQPIRIIQVLFCSLKP